ncbi:citrate lyase subunit beta / citryl-CoA lyase [Thermomonospora echinospora]|uniref:Citrate lyase subunit beta / citryl-CoA lyase n=1 Tax=Thermomonospora echinospora TaxID=1992 RepID=A0A1H5TEG9_9ACTN|nr:CoA ester lyase [Thermomonospora echinospora]SEF60407.1 citrate lyase subunit beta / citryl-CoA lyase [Thermomonospora echinospora]
MTEPPAPIRSALYVPGDQPGKLAKAPDRGADALIVDLEDAVPPQAKDRAREQVAAWLAGLAAAGGPPQIWVRVNPGLRGLADARAVALPAVTGLCVAKAETPEDLAALDEALGEAPWIALSPILESAAAVLAAPALARCRRVVRLQLGEADLRADLGVEPGPDERELLWARSQVVLASAAAGIGPPLGPVSTDFRDTAALRRSTEALRRLGFYGRACVHPAQLPVVHEVFTPSERELARARDLVERFEKADSGVVLDERGQMVDEAVIRQARRLLATPGTTPGGRPPGG